jgi:Fe-S-cluster-containing dehydrogenase component
VSKIFLVDIAKCSGCYNCQFACKDEHAGNDWTPYAKPQPDIGQFWAKVVDYPRGTTPKVKVHYVPQFCNHCDNPKCMEFAKNGEVYKREDGFVIIDPEKAVGMKELVEACPYGAIYWNEELNIPQKCTGCAHLLDNGYKLPRCVESCPTDALRFGEKEDFADELRGAQVLKPETGCGPNVYYMNMPMQFIAATVYDPETNEVVIGARVIAVYGGRIYETWTDEYGDFWFKDLPVGKFDVTIIADGYERKNFFGVDTEDCVNLGDIALEKKKD